MPQDAVTTGAEQAAELEVAQKGAEQAADEAADQKTDAKDQRTTDLEGKLKAAHDRYSQLMRIAKSQGLDTKSLKRQTRTADEEGENEDDRSSRSRDAAEQADFERRMASGELTEDDVRFEKRFAKLENRLENRLLKANQKVLQQMNETTLVKEEEGIAGSALDATVEDLGLTMEEAQEAIKAAGDLGIDTDRRGGPSRFAAAACRVMENMALRKALSQRTTKAEADAADQVRAAALTNVPGKGAAPGKKEPTRNEGLVAAMKEIKPKSTRSLLDSERAKT